MDAHGLGLAEAYGLIHAAPTAETGRQDWVVVVQKFLRSCKGRRETTLRDLRRRMARTLKGECVGSTHKPIHGLPSVDGQDMRKGMVSPLGKKHHEQQLKSH